MRNTLGSYKLRSMFEVLRLYRLKSSNALGDSNSLAAARPRMNSTVGGSSAGMQSAGARFIQTAATANNDASAAGKEDNVEPPPKPPAPSPPPRPGGRFPNWKFILGSVLSLLLALWTPKWATVLKIGGDVEVVISEVEQAAEVLEKVATVVEKVSEDVADNLPDGNKIKETALIVGHISEEAAKDAQIVEQVINKIDAAKHEIEDAGQMVEPIIEKIVHDRKSRKVNS